MRTSDATLTEVLIVVPEMRNAVQPRVWKSLEKVSKDLYQASGLSDTWKDRFVAAHTDYGFACSERDPPAGTTWRQLTQGFYVAGKNPATEYISPREREAWLAYQRHMNPQYNFTIERINERCAAYQPYAYTSRLTGPMAGLMVGTACAAALGVAALTIFLCQQQ